MLARTPFTEVEIEGVGTYRLPNQWQLERVNRLRGLKRHIAVLAVGCGMTVRQFMKLPDATKAGDRSGLFGADVAFELVQAGSRADRASSRATRPPPCRAEARYRPLAAP